MSRAKKDPEDKVTERIPLWMTPREKRYATAQAIKRQMSVNEYFTALARLDREGLVVWPRANGGKQ